MASLPILLVTGALFLLLFRHLWLNYNNPALRSIPGPRLWWLSDVWRFIDSCRGRHELTSLRLHRKYGSVVRIGPNVVSVADPESVDAVLGFKSNLDKSDQVLPMQNAYKGQPLPMLISAIDSKYHMSIKRPVAGAYSMTSVLQSEGIADKCIGDLVRQLDAGFGALGKPCSLDRWMHYLAFDFIGQATFSKRFGFLEAGGDIDNMIKIIDLQFIYIGTLGNMPLLDKFLLKNPLLLALVETPNPLVDMARQYIEDRRAGVKEGSAEQLDFLAKFLDAQKRDPGNVPDLQVAAYVAANGVYTPILDRVEALTDPPSSIGRIGHYRLWANQHHLVLALQFRRVRAVANRT
jgi:hypothetical protein